MLDVSDAEKVIYLEAALKREQEERKAIIDTLKKALSVLGLFPVPNEKEIKKVAIKSISSLATQFITNPKGVEQKFAFFADIMPIVEKYKDE